MKKTDFNELQIIVRVLTFSFFTLEAKFIETNDPHAMKHLSSKTGGDRSSGTDFRAEKPQKLSNFP